MTLVVEIKESKNVSLWKEYKDAKGNVLAEFKIRGAAYPAYQVAIERAHNQVSSKGFDVTKASSSDKLLHELHLDAAACHLIEDWKGVALKEKGEIIEVPYSPENAMKLFNLGDIGPQIWAFIKTQSELIQYQSDLEKAEILGKSESSTSTQSELEALPTTKRNKGKQKASK